MLIIYFVNNRSNKSELSKTIQKSMWQLKTSKSVIHRSKSDVDEIASSVSKWIHYDPNLYSNPSQLPNSNFLVASNGFDRYGI